ncbi:MAG TPA: VOC family protein [Candidatus Binatia bacterium]|nr:VOC family protein [Candidatus Binatia bacterium]
MRATCTHVALHCRDIDASVAFYARYAGLHEVHRRSDGDMTVVWLGESGRQEAFVIVLLGMQHADAEDPAPMAHFGYAVAAREDVDAVAELALADGCEVMGPIYAGPIVGYFCMVRDPDRNWVEFSFGQSLGHDIERTAEQLE